jgi:hypothetical protein
MRRITYASAFLIACLAFAVDNKLPMVIANGFAALFFLALEIIDVLGKEGK